MLRMGILADNPLLMSAQRSYIQELPPELLCEVFAAIRGYADLVTSTHVCKHWRAVSLAHPARLWADVRSFHKLAGVFSQTMARTQQVPTRVTVGVGISNAEEVASVLEAHLFHIQPLLIQFSVELDTSPSESIARALSAPAPLLQRLVVLDKHNVLGRTLRATPLGDSPFQIFGGQTPPFLTRFKLYGDPHAYAGCPALSNVRHVMYSPAGSFFYPAHLTAALRFGPFECLEMLSLWMTLWSSLPTLIFPLPRRLRALCLNVEHPRNLTLDLLRSLDDHRAIAHIRIVYINSCEKRDASELLDYFLSSPGHVVDLEIDRSPPNPPLFRGVTSTGMLREVYGIPAVLPQNDFAHLTRLSVSEWQWTSINVFPSAPLLAHLVLIVAPETEHYPSARSVLAYAASGDVLCAPMLHTFAVSSRRRSQPAVAPDAVAQFLRTKLVYDRDKLSVLSLDGVRFIEHRDDQLADLLKLVDVVQHGPRLINPLRDLDDLVLWN